MQKSLGDMLMSRLLPFFQPKEKIFFNHLFPTHFTDDKRAIFFVALLLLLRPRGGQEKKNL